MRKVLERWLDGLGHFRNFLANEMRQIRGLQDNLINYCNQSNLREPFRCSIFRGAPGGHPHQ